MACPKLDFEARCRLTELTRHLRTWRYEGGKRDLRLDMLRGFAALAMMADHVSGAQSWLVPITGGNRFFVSAAEAFVFISGALVGVVYGKLMLKNGTFAGMSKAIKRAAKLYVLTIVLTLSYALTGNILGLWFQPDVSKGGVLGFVIEVVTLQRTLFLVDILLMYACLLLVATPVLWLLSRGYTPIVICGSWLIWGAWQASPGTIDWQIDGNNVFHLAAWQAIFFMGLVLGFHREAIERWLARLPRLVLVAAVLAVSAATVVLYVAQLTHLEELRADPTIYALCFAKENVPAGRLAAFTVMGSFSFALLTVAWLPLRRATGWLLLPLGQNALTSYSLHLFVVAAEMKASQVFFRGDLSPAVSTMFQIVCVMTVWLVVQLEPAVRLYFRNKMVPAMRLHLSGYERNAGRYVLQRLGLST